MAFVNSDDRRPTPREVVRDMLISGLWHKPTQGLATPAVDRSFSRTKILSRGELLSGFAISLALVNAPFVALCLEVKPDMVAAKVEELSRDVKNRAQILQNGPLTTSYLSNMPPQVPFRK